MSSARQFTIGSCQASQCRARLGQAVGLLIVAAMLFSSRIMTAQESKPKKEVVVPKPPASAAKKTEKKPSRKLSGAELYALHCNRCHPERYAPERTADQWKTILLHMRTRANLPAEQARTILQFLQDDSGR